MSLHSPVFKSMWRNFSCLQDILVKFRRVLFSRDGQPMAGVYAKQREQRGVDYNVKPQMVKER